MSGQQHGPVPETAPLTPAPQPDGHTYQPAQEPAPAAPPTAAPPTARPAARPVAAPDDETDRLPVSGPAPETSAGWGAGWGGPPSTGNAGGSVAGGKPWTMKRGLVVAGTATVLAAQDGGSVGGPGGMQAPGSGTMPGGGGDFAPGGLGGMGSGVSAAVHSEYVVEEDGQYVTKVAQLGTVSAVSSGSVTVKSADGFTRTYTLSSETVVGSMLQRRQQLATGGLTVADIVSGATIRIVAGKDGSAFAAESVQVSGTGTNLSGGSTGSSGTGSSQSS